MISDIVFIFLRIRSLYYWLDGVDTVVS